jgi:hypothetical protein
MKIYIYSIAAFVCMLALSAVLPNKEIISSNGTVQKGSSVVCPDNTSQWVCSISSSRTRNAPPPEGMPVLVGKNAQGHLTITFNKGVLTPELYGTWFQNNQFYTPQSIEIDRALNLSVLGVDSVTHVGSGYYPLTESETNFQVVF